MNDNKHTVGRVTTLTAVCNSMWYNSWVLKSCGSVFFCIKNLLVNMVQSVFLLMASIFYYFFSSIAVIWWYTTVFGAIPRWWLFQRKEFCFWSPVCL